MAHAISRRHVLTGTPAAVGAAILGQAPVTLGQQVRARR
ncbi:MAG: twin-arginine translocation signal domain-containing protein [Candidatus Rokubacteria bacterium]|nr:twin-arginine translocation signal domain-containing protein [Candidatus Rokubacteria bacterium]